MTSEETTPFTPTEVPGVVKCAYCCTEVRKSTTEKFMTKAMGRVKKAFREREIVYHDLCPTCFQANEALEALVKELTNK